MDLLKVWCQEAPAKCTGIVSMTICGRKVPEPKRQAGSELDTTA